MRLTDKDLKKFQEAIQKDYGIKLEGDNLYQNAFNFLKFFEALIKFDSRDKVQKSSKRLS